MESEITTIPAPVATVPPPIASQPGQQPGQATEETTLTESTLDSRLMEAYRMKLAGQRVQTIADKFNVRRETIWRWAKQVESEFIEELSSKPVFNVLVEELRRLTDLEERSRQLSEQTKSDRAKIGYLAEARRAATARQNLLVTVGVLPKTVDRIFSVISSYKPQEAYDPNEERSKAELFQSLVDSLLENHARCQGTPFERSMGETAAELVDLLAKPAHVE